MDPNTEFDMLTTIPRRSRTEAQNARVRELAALITEGAAVAQSPTEPAQRRPVRRSYRYTRIRDARRALRAMERGVEDDMGREAVEAAWYDIVNAILLDCSPGVAAELRRQEGME